MDNNDRSIKPGSGGVMNDGVFIEKGLGDVIPLGYCIVN